MLRLARLADLPADLRGGVVAIGNFDGVHRGHQAVLGAALDRARQAAIPALVLTFEPHPRSVFRPDMPLHRITPPGAKARVLASMAEDGKHVDAVVEMPFTRDFASLSADEFISSVLMEGFGARHVVTGFDFHFGKNRQGGPAYMMEAGKREGFEVTLVDAMRDADAEVISSSRIRERLADGDVDTANALLGYRYQVAAPVIAGQQLGRTLGYPTANMALPADTPLAHGIYAVRFLLDGEPVRDGVASFGRRPTVENDGAPLLETFVFDFSGDLYGRHARVCLFGRIRGEERFGTLDALTAQMRHDERVARAMLADASPLSPLDRRLAFDTVA